MMINVIPKKIKTAPHRKIPFMKNSTMRGGIKKKSACVKPRGRISYTLEGNLNKYGIPEKWGARTKWVIRV